MKEILSDIISKFTDDYRNASPKMRIVLIVSVATASVIVMGTLLRSCLSSPTSYRRRAGLSSLVMTDENGHKWVLDPLKGQPLSRFKNVDAKPGPPLLVKTDVETKGNVVSIGLIVEGQAGEKYVGGARKNGEWQPAPRLRIVNEAGKALALGKFEYG